MIGHAQSISVKYNKSQMSNISSIGNYNTELTSHTVQTGYCLDKLVFFIGTSTQAKCEDNQQQLQQNKQITRIPLPAVHV